MSDNFKSYTPPSVPKNKIIKPSVITEADISRIRDIRDSFGDEAKSINDVFGGSEYISDLNTELGFKSSAELDIDFSRFENHTFFGSAEQYTLDAFSKILSSDGMTGYPYYASEAEFQVYKNNLTGFENWVFENYPKNKGFLHFDEQFYILSKDVPSSLLASDREITGLETVNPTTGSMTIEFWLNPSTDAITETTGTLFDFRNSGNGYKVDVLTGSAGLQLRAMMISGSRNESASISIPKSFEHYACIFDRTKELDRIKIYANSNLSGTSGRKNEIGSVDITSANIYIGANSSGSDPVSGSLDELRIWNSVRTPEQLKINSKRTVRAQSGLKLLYNFNEISGNERSVYVVDNSGQEIHGVILGTTGSYSRQTTGSLDYGFNPMRYEESTPILFSDNEQVVTFYTRVLNEAIQYDLLNPSLITKLIPEEILKMSRTGIDPAMELERRGEVKTQLSEYILGSSIQKTSQVKGVLETFLYVIAKTFDEIKVFIDHLSDLNSDSFAGRRFSDSMLNDILSRYGIDLKGMFSETALDAFIKGESVDLSGDVIAESLEQIRGSVWRRVFNSMTGLLKSKGTRESVKGMFRAMGIDPDSNFRIKEFGGFNQTNIENRFVRNSKITPFIDFNSGSLGAILPVDFIYNTSMSNISEGFHIEHLIQLPNNSQAFAQSLGRLGWQNESSGTWDIHSECVAYSGLSADPRIEFTYQPVSSSNDSVKVSILGNYFDGNIYRLSYGRKLYNSGTLGDISGTYYITMNAVEYDDIQQVPSFNSVEGTVNNDIIAYGSNLSGADALNVNLFIGESLFPNAPEVFDSSITGFTNAEFKIAEIHIYNDGFEWQGIDLIHRNNPFSLALANNSEGLFRQNFSLSANQKIKNPLGNLFNSVQLEQSLNSTNNGQNLPVISSSYEPFITGSSDFNIPNLKGLVLTNFAQTFIEDSGSLINVNSYLSSTLDLGEDPRTFNTINYKELTMDWDRNGADDLDRIVIREGEDRYFPSFDKLPVYDPRVSIDFSVVDALNNDISLIIGSLETLGSAISSYKNRYNYDFDELQHLRKIYFTRLDDKIQMQNFFKFFRYFDDNLIDFIVPMIPAKAQFLGGRFVIEPHALERSKNVYQDYNFLFSPGRTPREIRFGAGVPVIIGSFNPVGSEPGGITAGLLHNGGSSPAGNMISVNRISTQTQAVVNGAISVPNNYMTISVKNQYGQTQQKFVDFDEVSEFNYGFNLFKKGNSKFIRFLFGEDA